MSTRLALGALLAACCSHAAADTVVFSTLAGSSFSVTSAPNTIMGEAFSMSPGTPVLTGIDVPLANTTGVNIVNRPMRVTVYLWNHASLATSGETPAFSDLVRTEVLDMGTISIDTGFVIVWNLGDTPYLHFSSPVTMGGFTNLGISFRWQVDNGSGFVDMNNLTTPVRTLQPPEVGVNALGFGYYRNASGLNDGNFVGSDARQLTANSNVAFKLFAAVPAPASLAVLVPLLGWGACGRHRS